MIEVFEGRCQCGQITYRIVGESKALFVCHCKECQRQSASAFGMALWVVPTNVEVVGILKDWVRDTPSGNKMICQFCPECGTRIFHRQTGQDDLISIKPGTLNNTKGLCPIAHIWCDSAQPWVDLDEQRLIYPANPPDIQELFDAWQNSR